MQSKRAGSKEFKRHLSHYLRAVERGDVVTITRRGAPIAELRRASGSDAARVPVIRPKRERLEAVRAAIASIHANGPMMSARDVREAIEWLREDKR